MPKPGDSSSSRTQPGAAPSLVSVRAALETCLNSLTDAERDALPDLLRRVIEASGELGKIAAQRVASRLTYFGSGENDNEPLSRSLKACTDLPDAMFFFNTWRAEEYTKQFGLDQRPDKDGEDRELQHLRGLSQNAAGGALRPWETTVDMMLALKDDNATAADLLSAAKHITYVFLRSVQATMGPGLLSKSTQREIPLASRVAIKFKQVEVSEAWTKALTDSTATPRSDSAIDRLWRDIQGLMSFGQLQERTGELAGLLYETLK